MMGNLCNAGNRDERSALFGQIGEVSFVIDELRLFLDTHPDCREALAMYETNRARRRELIDSYTAKYGPIEAYSAGGETEWNWTDAPMPWESEAN